MDIYRKLPTDLQKIIDRMLHELDYSNVVNQIYKIFRSPKNIIAPRMLSNLFNGHIYHLCYECRFEENKHLEYMNYIDDPWPYYYYYNFDFLPETTKKIINSHRYGRDNILQYTDMEYYKYKEDQIKKYGYVKKFKLIV